MEFIETIIKICEINNRVCLNPQNWNNLWNLLKNKKRFSNGFLPPAPLILGAWHYASDFEKKNRLMEHLDWAKKEGQLEEIKQYLEEMEEIDWFHFGE